MDEARKVLLYLAVELAAFVAAIGLVVWFLKKDKFKDFAKCALGVAVGFSVCALTFMTYLSIKDDGTDMATYGLVFYPIVAELAVALAGGVAMLICSLFGKKQTKIAGIITLVLLLGGFVAIMVEMAKYYALIDHDYYHDFNLIGLIVSAVIFGVLIVIVYLLGDKRDISDTRSIVYGAIAIAMSFALSYIRLFKLPQGGSVTFASLLPLMIYCAMFGTRRGTITCLIYGLLQAVQDPWIIHPMQFLLDYPLAFGLVGVSGIFIEKGVFKGNKKIIGFVLGAIIGATGRYICHVCSGVFAFAAYADAYLTQYGTVIAYSMAYNSFALVDIVVAIAAGCFLFLSKSFTSQMERSADISHISTPAPAVDADADDDFVFDIPVPSLSSNEVPAFADAQETVSSQKDCQTE